MFWECVSRTGPVALVKVTGKVDGMEHWGAIKNMNSAIYEDMLTLHLLPYLEKNIGAVFQQDGAPIHTSKAMKRYFDQFGITPPFWPPKSPDLSVIENVWGLIKAALAKLSVTTLSDIEVLVPKLWHELVTEKYCIDLYESISARIDAVIANNGARVNY